MKRGIGKRRDRKLKEKKGKEKKRRGRMRETRERGGLDIQRAANFFFVFFADGKKNKKKPEKNPFPGVLVRRTRYSTGRFGKRSPVMAAKSFQGRSSKIPTNLDFCIHLRKMTRKFLMTFEIDKENDYDF